MGNRHGKFHHLVEHGESWTVETQLGQIRNARPMNDKASVSIVSWIDRVILVLWLRSIVQNNSSFLLSLRDTSNENIFPKDLALRFSYNSRRIGTLVLTKISFQKEKPRKSFRCERWKIESNRRLNTVKLDEKERERGGEYCNNIIRCWLLLAQRYRKSWLKSGQPRRPQKWNRVESARQSLYA